MLVPRILKGKIKKECWQLADEKKYALMNNTQRKAFMNELYLLYENDLKPYGKDRVYIKDSIMKGYRATASNLLGLMDEHKLLDKYADSIELRGAKVYKSKNGSRRFPLGKNVEADLFIYDDGYGEKDLIVEGEPYGTWRKGLAQAIEYVARMELQGKQAKGLLIVLVRGQIVPAEEKALIEKCCMIANISLRFI